MEKPCTKCGETKALTEFYKNNSYRSRRGRVCKTCYSTKKGRRTPEDIARFKLIMSVPVNIKKTQAHYMVGPVKETQKEIRLR